MAPKKQGKKPQGSKQKGQKQPAEQDKEQKEPPKKPERWRQQAEARVRLKKQRCMADVPVFTIDINATPEEFDKFTEDRVNHMHGVASTFVGGSPVTPPKIKGHITYHRIRLTDKDGGGPSVELLVQDHNLYMTAFRTIIDDAHGKESGGWFVFKDCELPEFMEGELIGYTSSYGKSSSTINVGYGVLAEIRSTLLGFNTDNREEQNHDRESVLHSSPYMVCETVRLENARREVIDYMLQMIRHILENPLVNQWGNICRTAFRFELLGDKEILHEAAHKYKLVLQREGSKDWEMSLLVGPEGYLRVLLYDEEYVQGLIEKQEKANPPTDTIVIKNLVAQSEFFEDSDLSKEVLTPCSMFGRVMCSCIEDSNVFVRFSNLKAADAARIFFDGKLIGGKMVEATFAPTRR